MATTVTLKKLLHRKAWEYCTASPASPASGSFVVSDKDNQLDGSPAFIVISASTIYRYDGEEDAYAPLPASGAAGAFAAGSCGALSPLGALGGAFIQAATGGSTTTLVTNKTILKNLAGVKVQVIGGTGIGYIGNVASNTLGANATITVTPASGVAFDATTQFRIYSGSLWFFNAGTSAVGFSVYDIATNAWTAKSVTNLPTAWGTEGTLIAASSTASPLASGTATSGSTTTLVNTAKNWATNMWANMQVRITAGTGKGQIATITSNTATTLTFGAVTTALDATSVYSIESNDDVMYLAGNNAVTLYKYVVSTNTWSTLAPTTARAAAYAAGGSASLIDNAAAWTLPVNEAPVAVSGTSLYGQNGRYIYSFRGGGVSSLDIYDIAANTWINTFSYAGQSETFTTGAFACDVAGAIYLSKESGGRIMRFDVANNSMKGFATNIQPQSTVVVGAKAFMLPYVDGASKVWFYYTLGHSISMLQRMVVV